MEEGGDRAWFEKVRCAVKLREISSSRSRNDKARIGARISDVEGVFIYIGV